LPNGWLNSDFTQTTSFSDKLLAVSTYYKTFSKVLTVRTISAEYLIAMKLMSGRQYKNDLSDIIGILWEHQKNGIPIEREAIDKAITTLYGHSAEIPLASQKALEDAYADGDFKRVYEEIRETELQAKDILLDFGQAYPSELKGENIDEVLARAREILQKNRR
jgi:hypothetical protein